LILSPENLTNADGVACTPFSMAEIQQYIEFLDFSKKLEAEGGGVPVAKNIIIANIIANFCALSIIFLVRWTSI
jgi:hypothetical protein